MKTIRICTILAALAAVAFPVSAFAAKGNKAGKGAAKAVRQYDTNANGTIDGDEVEALRKAFEADKTGALKELDKDSDGKLSDAEISAIKVHQKKAK